MKIEIIKSGLSEEDAYSLEYETIMYYINQLGYGIDIDGYKGDDDTHFLTNKTFGSRGCIGESNAMYKVSPKERMSEDKYFEWFQKTSTRLKNQIGEKNPNYKNDTLHNKVKDNPELRIKYYSRPGSQNGRSKQVEIYDINHNYIATFDYIGACCEWLKNELNLNTKVDSIRSNITYRTKNNKPYLNHYFKFI